MNALSVPNVQVPAHIAARFGNMFATNDDLAQNVGTGGYPVISFKGKVWAVAKGDEKTVLLNEDGDPVPSIKVVILKANPNLSKVYYPNGYSEGSDEKPVCYSHDAITPALDAQERQAAQCAVCPHNQWGSRITESGARGKACSDSRRLAVAPVMDLENPMLLRVPAATLKDLAAYAAMLNQRKAPYQALVTQIGFDHTVAYQRLTFKAVGWLDETQVDKVAATLEKDVIKAITGEDAATANAAAEAATGVEALPPPPAHVAKVTKPKKHEVQPDELAAVVQQATPAPAAVVETDMFGSAVETAVTPVTPAPAPVADPTPVVPPAPTVAAAAVTAVISEANASLADVLAAFDDA